MRFPLSSWRRQRGRHATSRGQPSGRIVTFEHLEARMVLTAGSLRVVSYNITAADTLPRAGLGTLVEAMGSEVIGGLADQVDLLAIQEVQSQSVTSAAVVSTLNGIYGAGTYATGRLNGASTGSGTQGVVYNTASLRLLEEKAIGTASTSGGPRQTLRYKFEPLDGDAASTFYIYVSHFKSLDTTADATRRNVEAQTIRADADALPEGTNILYVGDFNLYRSSDPSYQTLLAAGNGQAFDPINRPGDWHSSSSFTSIFTQAPLAVAPAGFTGGGLDDRFDFQIVSGEVMDPGGFTYVAGSYHTFGNNGSVPRNGSINDARNTSLSGLANRSEVLDLLTTVSDHLPVVADYTYTLADVSPPAAATSDLFFSEYVEGSSNNKYLEIYNGGATAATLANYEVRLFTNGAATATTTQSLGTLAGGPATLAPGSTLVLRNGSAALTLPAGVTAYTSGVTNFNGDDALAIWKTTTSSYVDIFGVIGTDPGSAWTSGSLTTLNATLRRKNTVTQGVTTNPTSFATLATEWDGFPQDTVTGLGTHSATPPAPASITGYAWNDADGDGTWDVGETAAAGWTIFLDTDGNGLVGPTETSTVTSFEGRYAFTGLAAGTYAVTMLPQDGWEQTFPAGTSSSASLSASMAPIIATASAVATDPAYTPDVRQQQPRSIPNDPLFSQQWHLNNTGQSGGTAGQDARLTSAWNVATGSGVVIGVVDDGLQWSHPDLSPNYQSSLSYDFNYNDTDPSPSTGDDHGTAAAGVAAARGNNGIGVSGSAPNAGLAGLRLIALATTDQQEATALSYKPQDIDIYSNSWGPNDDGITLEAPGPLTKAAFANGAATGRGGLGSIYVWAAGNGLDVGDNSNYDGYANSRYTIAVSAVDHNGKQSWYSEPGSNILVAAPSSGGTSSVDAGGIVTTDRTGTAGYNTVSSASGGDYAYDFGGTSSAAPLVAGVAALVLQANPSLGWRDVQQVLARSARRNDPTDAGWSQNGAGLWVNEKYGFGTVDAAAAVTLAKTWTNVGAEMSVASGTITVGQTMPDSNATGITSSFTVGADITVQSVEISFSATHASRGQLRVVLTSPSGTRSVLADRHADTGDHYVGWTFSTVRDLGESAVGTWTLTVSDLTSGTTGTFDSWGLTIYGTQGSNYVAPPTPHSVVLIAGQALAGVNFGVHQIAPPGSVYDVPGGDQLIDTTLHTDADAVIKQGAGTLVLELPNTHTGGTSVEAGEVIVRAGTALGTGPVSIAATSRLTLDVGAGEVTAATLANAGLVDLGTGRLTVTTGLDAATAVSQILAGRGDGTWHGAAGISSQAAAEATALGQTRGVGWLVNDDGSITVAFAAAGDTNLDRIVDLSDAANVLAGGAFDTGGEAGWNQGDFNYDGVVDMIDIADFVGTGLFDQADYVTAAPASSPELAASLSSVDAAFLAFGLGDTLPTTKKKLVAAPIMPA